MFETAQDKEKQQKLDQHRADLKWVTSSASGRRVLAHILRHGGLFQNSFVRAGGNEGTTEFYEGMRNMALILHNDLLRHCPDELKLVFEELHK